jgi:hypothetical protein
MKLRSVFARCRKTLAPGAVHLGLSRLRQHVILAGASRTAGDKLTRLVFGAIATSPVGCGKDNVNYLREFGDCRPQRIHGRSRRTSAAHPVRGIQGPICEDGRRPRIATFLSVHRGRILPACGGYSQVRGQCLRSHHGCGRVCTDGCVPEIIWHRTQLSGEREGCPPSCIDVAAVPLLDREKQYARTRATRQLRTGFQAVVLPVERAARSHDVES